MKDSGDFEFTLRLSDFRVAKGLTQQDLATSLGVSLSTYRTWERGTSRISLEVACRAARLLGCTPNDLCGWPAELNDGRTYDNADERRLIGYFRYCSKSRRERILSSAYDAAVMSGNGEKIERYLPEGEEGTPEKIVEAV